MPKVLELEPIRESRQWLLYEITKMEAAKKKKKKKLEIRVTKD